MAARKCDLILVIVVITRHKNTSVIFIYFLDWLKFLFTINCKLDYSYSNKSVCYKFSDVSLKRSSLVNLLSYTRSEYSPISFTGWTRQNVAILC
jgi:hypothetical protein